MLSRTLILKISDLAPTKAFITRSSLSRGVVKRFVAGDTVPEAIEAAKILNSEGFVVSLDQLGENTKTKDEANRATDDYLQLLDAISESGVDANISIKLTQLGLDMGAEFAQDNLYKVLDRAKKYNDTFVRIDMEGSPYTEVTLQSLEKAFPNYKNVGTVIQSYLHRSPEDVERLIALGARVRLVKGAYLEPAEIAYQKMDKVDEQFDLLAEKLIATGNYPAIATQDPKRINFAREYAKRNNIPNKRFEFQMLYGIRRDLQRECRDAGFNTRIYVPYGVAWYPYFSRRLAERPANVLFFVKNLFKK